MIKKHILISSLLLGFSVCAQAQLFPDATEQELLEYDKMEIEVLDDEDELDVPDNAFVIVDEMPEFPGGHSAMTQFIERHRKYPTDAHQAGVEGNVYVSFIVLTDGTLSDFNLVSGIGHGCDEEALRVAKLMMTRWTPGKQMGHPVNVKYILTVPFKMSDQG